MGKSVKAKVVKPKGASWVDRYKVKLKLKSPRGIRLTQGETEALVEIQQKDVKVLKDNQQEVLAAMAVTHTVDVKSQIKRTTAARSVAASNYKQSQDPIKKREWARRLVVADNTHKSLNELQDRMVVTRDRLEMIKGDIEMQLIEAEAKVAETTAYAKAGKQLRLAGETLVNARTRAKSGAIEYTNLEISMEGAEKLINDTKPEALLAQADAIVGGEK
jgi:hypothetical protein